VIACFCGDQSPQMRRRRRRRFISMLNIRMSRMWQIVQDMNTREL
jgi:hypothetical protein